MSAAPLSGFQRRIVALSEMGLSNAEIGIRLQLTEQSVADRLQEIDAADEPSPVLLCASPVVYLFWRDGRVEPNPPVTIVAPSHRFCLDAIVEWCAEQRALGRCHLNDESYQSSVGRRQWLRERGDTG